MFFRSVVMFMVIAIVPLFIMRGILLASVKDKLYSERVDNIRQHSNALVAQMIDKNYFQGENKDVIHNQISQLANIYDGRIVVIDSSYRVMRDSYFRIFGKTVISKEAFQSMQGEEIWRYHGQTDMVEMAQPVIDDGGVVLGVMLISSSTATRTAAYLHIKRISTWIVGGISIVLIGIAFFFYREHSKPFRELAKTINYIAE